MAYTFSQNGFQFLQAREGVELTAYNKDGVWTIGYGNTFYENGIPVKKGDKITQARAESLFKVVALQFSKQVSNLITASLTQSQFDALVSLAYNIGISNFRKSTLLKLVNKNPKDSAIRKEFLKWIYSQGKVLQGLINRRKLEADLYFSAGGAISTTPATTAGIGGFLFFSIVLGTILYK
ncbi:lysozyme [Emticicia sp. W12TSBA100-4]|uniref:lysozyme n=1 Tax=Emticicia sp. W12TSBA100-4 TaxID=3160965 RepID=UPI0033056538